MGKAMAQGVDDSSRRRHMRPYAYNPADVQEGPRYPVMRQEFDTKTRIKGNLIFWTGFFSFLCFMREFLVWSAGSTYAWSRPADLNPFWIRRFQNDWVDKAAKDREEVPQQK